MPNEAPLDTADLLEEIESGHLSPSAITELLATVPLVAEQRGLLLACLDMLNRVNTPDKELGRFCSNLSRSLIPTTTLT